MGHGTLVDGVQRLVTAGLDLVDGVQRKQKKGLTLVGGVQREISIGSSVCTIVITVSASMNMGAYVEIGGVQYKTAQTIEVSSGTQMYCRGMASGTDKSAAVTLNGVAVAETSGNYGEYTHTITKDTAVNIATGAGLFPYISITE